MKKLLSLGLMFCALCSTQAATTSYDITTSNKDGTGTGNMSDNTGNGYIMGFKLCLSSNWFFPTELGSTSKIDLPDQVILDSMSLTQRTSNTDSSNVFIVTGDATQPGGATVVGFGLNQGTSNGLDTWSFGDNLVLDTSVTYTFIFTRGTSINDWTDTTTVLNAGGRQGIRTAGMGTHIPGSYDSGQGMYNNKGLFVDNLGSVMKFSVSAVSVPEPSTSVLALMGIGSLLLRRRVCR